MPSAGVPATRFVEVQITRLAHMTHWRVPALPLGVYIDTSFESTLLVPTTAPGLPVEVYDESMRLQWCQNRRV